MKEDIKPDTFYTVSGCAPLDGFEAKGVEALGGASLEVHVLRRSGMLIGDRPLQIAVEPGTLLVSRKCLTVSRFPSKMEFSDKNPFGQLVSTRKVIDKGWTATIQRFTKAITIETRDPDNCVAFARTFFDPAAQADAIDSINAMYDGDLTIEGFSERLHSLVHEMEA